MPEPWPLHAVRRDHLETLARGGPIAQHARVSVPDPAHGSCTDDVARALQVDLLHGAVLGWPAVAASAWRSLRYLEDALVEETRRFLNFRDSSGTWLEEVGSEDSHGRAILALGEACLSSADRAFRDRAAWIVRRALPGTAGLTALRAISSAAIGLELAHRSGLDGEATPVQRQLMASLAARFEPVAWSMGWPWPEAILTYEAALPARALIITGRRVGDHRIAEMGLAVLDWLARSSLSTHGHLSPVGNDGWWPRWGVRATFDQQPIEAASLLLAAETAFEATGNPRWLEEMERAYGWFLGANDLGLGIADPERGGCRDGLLPGGCNLNQGAESTLAWLASLEHVRARRAAIEAVA
jgi:hypothetical protein